MSGGTAQPFESPRALRARRAALPWIAIPAIFSIWGALRIRGSSYFYDEWSLISQELHLPFSRGLLLDFNGHLWTFQYLIYRIQVLGFGIRTHRFVDLVLLSSLVSLQLSIAFVLRVSRVAPVTSLLVAGLLAYLSGAIQNSVFAVQAASNFAFATSITAVALVVCRPPDRRWAATVSVLLLASVGCDSGTALPMAVFATIVIVMRWRARMTVVAVPAIAALVAWYALAPLGPSWSSSIGTRITFAGNLLLSSLGALTGVPVRGEFLAGLLLFTVVAATLFVALRAGVIDRARRVVFIAGMVSTAVVVAAIAQTRAGLVGGDFSNYNRYLVQVDIPLVIATLPIVGDVLRGRREEPTQRPRRRMLDAVAPLLVVASFLMGCFFLRTPLLSPFQQENALVRLDVLSAAAVIEHGCPPGTTPDPASEPASSMSPQLTTGLLTELMRRGLFSVTTTWSPSPVVVQRMCTPSGS